MGNKLLILLIEHWYQFIMICVVITYCAIRVLRCVNPVAQLARLIKVLSSTLVRDELPMKMRAAIVNIVLVIMALILALAILWPSLVQQLGFEVPLGASRGAVIVFGLFILVLIISLFMIWQTKEYVAFLEDDQDDDPWC